MAEEAASQLETTELSANDRLTCVLRGGTTGVLENCTHSQVSWGQTVCASVSPFFFSTLRLVKSKKLFCSYGHTCEGVASSGRNWVQARPEKRLWKTNTAWGTTEKTRVRKYRGKLLGCLMGSISHCCCCSTGMYVLCSSLRWCILFVFFCFLGGRGGALKIYTV